MTIEIKKIKREDDHCHACGDTDRGYKYLYEMQFLPNVCDAPRAKVCICKECIKSMKGKIQRLRWS